jgi:hypothetical protein
MTENLAANGSGIDDAAKIYKDGTYLKNNETWHVEDSPWKAKHIATILHNNNINPRSVCEVGCGAGEILKQLSHAFGNTHFVGYELSPQAFKLCKERESEKVRYYLKNIFEQDAFYEVLLCIDVFEHVEDYIGFLKALKTKSTFKIFHIPLDVSVLAVLRSTMISARQRVGHLHYFTRETALATLKDCGYEIIDSFYTTPFFDFPSKTLKGKLARRPRKILFDMSPHLSARVLGGCSLLLLAK